MKNIETLEEVNEVVYECIKTISGNHELERNPEMIRDVLNSIRESLWKYNIRVIRETTDIIGEPISVTYTDEVIVITLDDKGVRRSYKSSDGDTWTLTHEGSESSLEKITKTDIKCPFCKSHLIKGSELRIYQMLHEHVEEPNFTPGPRPVNICTCEESKYYFWDDFGDAYVSTDVHGSSEYPEIVRKWREAIR